DPRRLAGTPSGDGDPHSGVGPAARPLRDRGCLEVGPQGRGTGLDQGPSLRQGPGRVEERRLPANPEGLLVERVFRATLVLATGVALLFLLLPIAAIFLRVPPGDLVAALGTSAAK